MSPSTLILIAILLLFVVPWLLLPRTREKPEIHGLLRLYWWLEHLYCAFLHRLELPAYAPLPEHGPALLISNHTSGVDSFILQVGCRRVLSFMIAQEFYDYWLFHGPCRLVGCIPLKRDSRDMPAIRAAIKALGEGRVVPIFPEGRISPTSGREIGEGKPGAAFIALKTKVPVIPAYISGTPTTTNIIKAILTPSRARVVFGPPIELWREFDPDATDKKTLARATDRLMDAIKALRTESLAREGRAAGPTPSSSEPPSDAHGPPRHPEDVPYLGAAVVGS
jgi:1-acyl-sn-glycerol-3-phosphate acyltransferase